MNNKFSVFTAPILLLRSPGRKLYKLDATKSEGDLFFAPSPDLLIRQICLAGRAAEVMSDVGNIEEEICFGFE